MAIITDLFYLPPIEYFVAVQNHQEIYLDVESRYQKQTYRNRTRILLTNKVETLSIPVLEGNRKLKLDEVKIDYQQKWKNIHLRGIQSAYGKAPFFEYYFPYIVSVYEKDLTNLLDLNYELLTVCLHLLGLDIKAKKGLPSDDTVDIKDIRNIIQAKECFSVRNIYQIQPYTQLFGLDFVPNLSIIDLLFCVGPESKKILKASQKND